MVLKVAMIFDEVTQPVGNPANRRVSQALYRVVPYSPESMVREAVSYGIICHCDRKLCLFQPSVIS